jgi:hypothetical protein
MIIKIITISYTTFADDVFSTSGTISYFFCLFQYFQFFVNHERSYMHVFSIHV